MSQKKKGAWNTQLVQGGEGWFAAVWGGMGFVCLWNCPEDCHSPVPGWYGKYRAVTLHEKKRDRHKRRKAYRFT